MIVFNNFHLLVIFNSMINFNGLLLESNSNFKKEDKNNYLIKFEGREFVISNIENKILDEKIEVNNYEELMTLLEKIKIEVFVLEEENLISSAQQLERE